MWRLGFGILLSQGCMQVCSACCVTAGTLGILVVSAAKVATLAAMLLLGACALRPVSRARRAAVAPLEKI